MNILSNSRRICRAVAVVLLGLAGAGALGQEMHHRHATVVAKAPVFVASTAKPFAALMADAMAVMDDGMRHAPMNGVSEHDFVTMMIPHHQGAVNMAKALLLTTKNLEMRNLAQGIITEQQNEINVMRAWLQRYQATPAKIGPLSIIKKE